MKAILSLVAAAAVLGFAAPSTAKADHSCGQTRVVGYTSCGTPIIAVYQIVGYDHCGRPVGQWVTQAPRQPSYGYNPGYSGHNHGGYSGYRPGYNPGYSRPRSGISFSFGFGR
ncbi:MAG: hypothetical protein ACKVY0_02225 [Prosthecobacter sp.]|uniref:hypothetical protein n=1 Tax=Prosthecobacter sp. TaxID=1965333 RepID=UPI0039024DCE